MKTHRPLVTRLAAGALLGAGLGGALLGCAAQTPNSDASPTSGGFPVTIENCGTEVTIPAKPKRIVMINNDELANLEALQAVDRIVAVTAVPARGLYEKSTIDAIDAITPLSTETGPTGGSIVSQESIIGAKPDLVIAPENAVDRASLASLGIPVFSPTAYCDDPPAEYTQRASFDRVWSELKALGTALGASDLADQAIAGSQAQLKAPASEAGTAAALYVSSGGVVSPYGGPSMVTPVFEAAGLTNVYAASTERVFDASLEDIIAKDPKTIVLLYSGDDAAAAVTAFQSVPGVQGLTAVKEHRVLTLPFPYTDPPTVLSTKGPSVLVEQLKTLD
ncbi:ABC transporter substrate-binding protein [Leifsonia sp. LS1]|uniref:ABC transporter substrate-binding protein n=1 Tax=Leifsonia sp. LS1 TaxID=2828483 RepID=UPI001CFF2B4A|nr:ABC transporter substrate-binding protein [Leifsonia sp. LS1]GIT81159.1 ABC transporter substrate-binding protein [Leifsonia sp. LS1]